MATRYIVIVFKLSIAFHLLKVFNDILGFRAFCDNYDPILEEESSWFRIADMTNGKAVDDGYRGVHVYYLIETGKVMREKYESGFIRNEHEFKEVLNHVLSGSERS